MNKKLIQAALTGLFLGAAVLPTTGIADTSEVENCYGINKCKGMGNCGIGKKDIEAANQHFKGKYKKSATMDCAGNNTCAAKKGILSWVPVGKGHCLKIAGGFLIQEKDGKRIVVEKQ